MNNEERARQAATEILSSQHRTRLPLLEDDVQMATSIILAALDEQEKDLRAQLTAAQEDSRRLDFKTGTPNVKPGSREVFWCATANSAGKIYHRHLAYLNGYIMPLCDSQDDPGTNAVAVGDDGDYACTGWYEGSCNQCDTQWKFTDNVIAWIKLPRHVAMKETQT